MTADTPQDDLDARLLSDLDDQLAAGRDPLTALASLLSRGRSRRQLLGLQGTRIHGHELTTILGAGGMGVTYAATDGHEQVAVKVVEGLTDPACERFVAECQTLQGLHHPGIVRYRGHGFLESGTAWLLMDLVDGLDLQALLDALADDPAIPNALTAGIHDADPRQSERFRRRVVRLVAAVADALHHAHEHGIVHRDVKPANILVRDDLEPVLIDFGLSRDLFRNVSLTRSAAVMGTLAYMAPEQLARDRGVDRRADVFALGLVLFRALTGRDLRENTTDLVTTTRRPFVLEPGVAATLPVALQAILYRCLDPRPARRYPTAAALADDLRAHLSGGTVRATRPNIMMRHLRSPRGGITKVAAAVAAVGLVAFLLWPKPTYLLDVDALDDLAEGVLILDGEQTPLHTPLIGHPISPGRHTLEYRGPYFRTVSRDFVVTGPITRINLLTIPTDIEIENLLHDGPDAALLVVHCGDATNQVTLDGQPLRPFARWTSCTPGLHTVEVRRPDGIVERQVVHLRAAERNALHLLSSNLKTVEGAFRLTLANVLSPLPAGMTLALGDHAIRFMNTEADKPRPGHIARHTLLAPAIPNVRVEATLSVEFDGPMHSVAFEFDAYVLRNRGVSESEYRCDDGPWHAIDHRQNERHRVQAVVPTQGARRFELRGHMLSHQPPDDYSIVRFLAAYADQIPENNLPCFAIVADPDPTRARLP